MSKTKLDKLISKMIGNYFKSKWNDDSHWKHCKVCIKEREEGKNK